MSVLYDVLKAKTNDKTKLALDLVSVRLMLEPEIAMMAADHATPEQIEEMRLQCSQIEELIQSGRDHMEADIRLHTLIASCSGNSVVEQVEKQLNKLIEVIKVRTLEDTSYIGRELMILKVNANNKTRKDIMTICEIMGGKVDDISPTSLTMELSDTPERLDTFQSMMRPFSILEVARTGMIAVQKGGGKI